MKQLQLRLTPEVAYNDLRLRANISALLDIDINKITGVLITRRSIDARQRRVMVNLSVTVSIDEPPLQPESLALPLKYARVPDNAQQVVVVGAGPAGLFAALRLIEAGIRPIVLERGKDVDARRPDMARICREGVVDPDSNYCFGEGGAGAFSDGKLYTRSKKRGSVEKILSVFYRHGASSDILVDAHPHIGTDRLPGVIKAMRSTIIDCGGEVRFNSRVTDLILTEGNVTGVTLADGSTVSGPVILATGHSARDVYYLLQRHGIAIEAKGIAVGVRLEHPQELIDRIQYHSPGGRGKYLPAAEYSMLTRVDGRAVYSFCMCPGGFVIPASSEPGQLVVNGMSPSNRGTRWANSGMVVEILPEDIDGDDPLKMMTFQIGIEQRFFAASPDGSQKAPAQRLTDFIAGKQSSSLADSSYAPGLYPARVDRLLPKSVASRLQKGFAEFGRKQRGFVTELATVIGDETRTSSPVRIPRMPDSMCHIGVAGLYPAGEGAGYAGGIVSAAIDGERVAEAVIQQIQSTISGI
ncbi:MAG: FAD-binding protein [Muribaculaceae bacterium]|nr:FAD-binding protein [Muribaculaceae bacterium]